MRWIRRDASPDGAPAPRGWRQRVGHVALVAAPLVAILIAILGLTGTYAAFQASITNTNNNVASARVGLNEVGPDGQQCSADGGVIFACTTINKFVSTTSNMPPNGTLVPGESSTTMTAFSNTGNADGQLFMLPSACSDSLTGANGALCDQVSVSVSCTNTGTVTTRTLNLFFSQRDFPNGYPLGIVSPGAANNVRCDITLTAAATITQAGTITQPITMRLVLATS